MLHSMTGYGVGSAQKDEAVVSVEIRTVNHRFLDLHIRLSREYSNLESVIQQILRGSLHRGRVDLNVTIQTRGVATITVNSETVRAYLEAAQKLRDEFNSEGALDVRTLLILPGVVQNTNENRPGLTDEFSGKLQDVVAEGVREALEGVLRMRKQEGEAQRLDMLRHLDGISEGTSHIRKMFPDAAFEAQQKLQSRIAQLLSNNEIDPQRLAQEVAFLVDKCDISEELARLESHIQQYSSLLDSDSPVGKKMDFLLQEMQREVNTMLSKSGTLEITRHGIALKADIEKLREQAQNVE
jgi:uncharacterized protein (TIGR00255 family)